MIYAKRKANKIISCAVAATLAFSIAVPYCGIVPTAYAANISIDGNFDDWDAYTHTPVAGLPGWEGIESVAISWNGDNVYALLNLSGNDVSAASKAGGNGKYAIQGSGDASVDFQLTGKTALAISGVNGSNIETGSHNGKTSVEIMIPFSTTSQQSTISFGLPGAAPVIANIANMSSGIIDVEEQTKEPSAPQPAENQMPSELDAAPQAAVEGVPQPQNDTAKVSLAASSTQIETDDSWDEANAPDPAENAFQVDGDYSDWNDYPKTLVASGSNDTKAEGAVYSNGEHLYGYIYTDRAIDFKHTDGVLHKQVVIGVNGSPIMTWRLVKVDDKGKISWNPKFPSKDGVYEFYITDNNMGGHSKSIYDLAPEDMIYGKFILTIQNGVMQAEWRINIEALAIMHGTTPADIKTFYTEYQRIGPGKPECAGTSTGTAVGIALCIGSVLIVGGFASMFYRRKQCAATACDTGEITSPPETA